MAATRRCCNPSIRAALRAPSVSAVASAVSSSAMRTALSSGASASAARASAISTRRACRPSIRAALRLASVSAFSSDASSSATRALSVSPSVSAAAVISRSVVASAFERNSAARARETALSRSASIAAIRVSASPDAASWASIRRCCRPSMRDWARCCSVVAVANSASSSATRSWPLTSASARRARRESSSARRVSISPGVTVSVATCATCTPSTLGGRAASARQLPKRRQLVSPSSALDVRQRSRTREGMNCHCWDIWPRALVSRKPQCSGVAS